MALKYLFDPIFEVVNSAGNPATGGYIEVYVHGTRDKYYCASDFEGTLLPFKIPLDSIGSNVVLADDSNAYDVYVYNRYGTLLMSRYKVDPVGGIGGGVKPSDLKTLTLKRGEHTIGSYNPLQQKAIDIGDSVLFVPDDTEDLHAKITQMLSNGTTPVLTKAVTVGGVESVYRYYPTARTGASSDYYFIGYNGGLIEFAKVKDDDSVSYETYEGGEGRIVYIGYGDADIYTKVSDAFAAGLVPVVKADINADTTIWTNYYWPLNLSAYEAPVPGEEDGRNGYYFVGKSEINDLEGNPLAALEMIQVKPDSSVSTSYIPEMKTPFEGYSDCYGIGIKTNKFGQVTEVTTGTQLGFNVRSGLGHSRKTLTAEEIAQGYFDIHIGLPRLIVGGRNISPEFVDVSNMVINVGLSDAMFDSDGNCSVLKAEVLFDFVDDDFEYFTKFICSVDDFKKDEFGRNLPADFFDSNIGKYVYSFLRTTRTDITELYIQGFILRCYINTAFIDSDPPAPGDLWVGPHVDIYVTSISNTMLSAIRKISLVTTPNTLRFEFSDLNYSPVVAGVGTSGTWTKRTEFSIPSSPTGNVRNIWDWTNSSSDWYSAFRGAWISGEMGGESVRLIAAGDTSEIIGVRRLFSLCTALRSSVYFDTSNVSDFDEMFAGCTSLEEVPYFDTDSATDVGFMFKGCTNVRSGALALYTRMSGQATPPDFYDGAFVDCGKDTTEGYAELLQIPASWGGLAP